MRSAGVMQGRDRHGRFNDFACRNQPTTFCQEKIGAVALLLLMFPVFGSGLEKADLVLVYKSQSKLLLKTGGETINEYRVAFGANPSEHKQQAGDERTPEMKYGKQWTLVRRSRFFPKSPIQARLATVLNLATANAYQSLGIQPCHLPAIALAAIAQAIV